jgi:hypothetical protein
MFHGKVILYGFKSTTMNSKAIDASIFRMSIVAMNFQLNVTKLGIFRSILRISNIELYIYIYIYKHIVDMDP